MRAALQGHGQGRQGIGDQVTARICRATSGEAVPSTLAPTACMSNERA
jgi:hypothetical protein